MAKRGHEVRPIGVQVAVYGSALAAGTAALQWLDYQHYARAHSRDLYVALIAAGFLVIGIVAGQRLFGAPPPTAFAGNPQAIAALGISPRELAVLEELAAGRSNKEIARRLAISPNTVKTHVSRLFEKLGATRRTEAIARARALGLLG